mgnify:CR=1 FL=1
MISSPIPLSPELMGPSILKNSNNVKSFMFYDWSGMSYSDCGRNQSRLFWSELDRVENVGNA